MAMGWPWSGAGPRQTCVFNGCTIQVSVVAGTVEVDIPDVDMYRGSRDVEMRWLIITPGYEFRPVGGPTAPIIFKGDNPPDVLAQFTGRSITPRGQIASVQNQNRSRARYTYKVRVYKQGGGDNDFLESDPAIFNDW